MVSKTNLRQQALTLDLFNQLLAEHTWSFNTDSYYDYFEAIKEEQELFRMAQMLSKNGVDAFSEAQAEAIRQMTDRAYDRGYKAANDNAEHSIQYLRKTLEMTRQKYMKPIDFFKEKLANHDWYYHYSDDRGVYRRGEAADKAIRAEAQAGGPEFIKALADKEAANAKAEKEQEERNRVSRLNQDELRTAIPKAVLDNWMLEVPEGFTSEVKDPVGMKVLYGPDLSGNTTRITTYDYWCRRFKTESGSIYELGEPNPEFAATYRRLAFALVGSL